MKIFVGLAMTLLMCGTAFTAEEKLREFRWEDLKAAGQLGNGAVLARCIDNKDGCLVVENQSNRPMTVQILEIAQPGITLPIYSLRGRIRYEAVEGTGYLDMWNYFPGGGAYFSRTLGDSGPMGSLRGKSDWRDLILPFSAAGTPQRPSRLVISLVLPGKGKVWLSALTLFQNNE